MKKYSFAIIGIVIQFIGIALMLYGLNNGRLLLWIGFPIVFLGLALILVGLFRNRAESK